MSINGTSYTFEALTLSGLGVSTDLSATYIPYANANSNANLNNKDLSNVKNITASNVTAGSNATVGTSYPLYAYNVFSYSPTVANILLNGSIQNPFQPGDTFRITGASISAINTTYIVIANYPVGGFFTVLNNAGLSGNNYPTGGIAYLNGTGTVSSIAVSTNILTASSSTISAETVGLLTATGVSQFGNVKITPFTSISGTILQYGVGGSPSTFSDRLLINNRSGNNILYFNDSGDVIQYTGRFQTPTLLLAGITSSFIYTDPTGICTGVQAIFSVGQTAGCSPNLLLAGGGAFSVSNTTNTQTYLAVLSTGITSTVDTAVPKLFLSGPYGDNYIKQGNQDAYNINSLNNNLLISSWHGIAFPTYNGTVNITMNTRNGDGYFGGTLTTGTLNTGSLNANGIANIYTGTRYAVPNGYMQGGSLTLGSINNSYGGGSYWSSNTAGLLFETNNNTEIQVHHSGYNITSLMYYDGTNQRIYIGRNSGWGAKPVFFQAPLTAQSTLDVGQTTTITADCKANGFILTGVGSYTNGCIYTDSNWGMLFRGRVNGAIACFNFRNADGTELMSITASGNMGIGTNTPLARLDVRGDMILRGGDSSTCLYGPNSSYNSYLMVGAGTGANQGNSQTAVIKTTNGNLHLDCAFGYAMYLNYYVNGYVTANTYYWGSFSYGSDERYKENIVTANNELCYENIKKIRIVRYNFIKDSIFERCTGNDKNRLGVLAQDLEKIYPNSVSETKDPQTDEPFKAIDTRQMYYTLVGCTQQLQNKVEAQQTIIEQQQKQIDEQKAQVASYEQRLAEHDAILKSLDNRLLYLRA